MNYLFAGFAVVWMVLFLFIIRIFNKQKQLSRELDAIRQELKESKPR